MEARGGAAGAGEDGDAVAVFVGVDEGDGVFDGGDVDADEDGAEDFFGVASHVGFHVGDDRGADLGICGQYGMELSLKGFTQENCVVVYPVAVWILLGLVAPSVEQDSSTFFLCARDDAFDPFFGLWTD